MRSAWKLIILVGAFGLQHHCSSPALKAAEPPVPKPIAGTVADFKTSSLQIVVNADDGRSASFFFGPQTEVVQVPPGERDLTKARPAHVTDLSKGDRILVSFVSGLSDARRIVWISATDIAARNEAERLDWQKRGISGTVVSSDGGEVTIETDGHAVRWRTYRDVTQTVAITKSRSSGTMTIGERTIATSTRAAPSIVQPRSAAPAVRVRRGMISTPPVTWTTPVKIRNHWPRPICSKIRTHTPRFSNLPYPMKMNRTPTAMAGRLRTRAPPMAPARDVTTGSVDSNMFVDGLNALDPDA